MHNGPMLKSKSAHPGYGRCPWLRLRVVRNKLNAARHLIGGAINDSKTTVRHLIGGAINDSKRLQVVAYALSVVAMLPASTCLVRGQVDESASGALAASQVSSEQLLGAEEEAFRAAVQNVANSVVQIETFGGLERVGDELVAEGPTTGTIVDPAGWIVSTLYSFRQQPASILVSLPDGQRAPARIVARDFSREVALLKVDVSQPLPVAPFAAKGDVQVGQWTVALGKTYDKQQVSQSVGIVSAVDRAYGKAIQTDAKVSPINYGGPLVDISGQVLGILSPLSPGVFLEGDSSQLYDSGIGFAIPMEDIFARLPEMQQGHDIHSGKLGVVSADQNELLGPVRITGTAPGSPAAKSKLQAGDVIVSAGGRPTTLLAHLKHALGPVDAGDTLPLVIEREGERLQFEPMLVAEIPIYRRRYLGLRLTETAAGVRIDEVEPKSPAAGTTLQIGQLITHCNGQPLDSRAPLQNAIAVAELDQPLVLHVLPAPAEPPPGTTEEVAATVDIPREPSPDARRVEILADTWPESIAPALPVIEPRAAASQESVVIDVVLGDVPNKVYAIVPPAAKSSPLGLLVVFPEPGELPRDALRNYWSDFCRDYGWIVVVINSGDPSGWTREEIELAGRVIGRLDNYKIDKARTVIAGLGVGGRIALAATLSEGQRVSGTLTIATDLSRFRWPRPNAPMQSVDFLLVGPTKALTPVAQLLNDKGYVANVVESGHLDLSQWETFPKASIQRWLAGLDRL